ncbi:MAG: hypothetical protein NTZ97_04775 [Candidatus Moranbacteria bacterium]|nr:hypothetical protein [Candidatus Moranbacteria bacterium]
MLLIVFLYLILLLLFIIAALFIVYHIAKYSSDSNIKQVMLLIFIIGALILFVLNIICFFTTDWGAILSKLKI